MGTAEEAAAVNDICVAEKMTKKHRIKLLFLTHRSIGAIAIHFVLAAVEKRFSIAQYNEGYSGVHVRVHVPFIIFDMMSYTRQNS